jgi:hypothetical protein
MKLQCQEIAASCTTGAAISHCLRLEVLKSHAHGASPVSAVLKNLYRVLPSSESGHT